MPLYVLYEYMYWYYIFFDPAVVKLSWLTSIGCHITMVIYYLYFRFWMQMAIKMS